MTGAEHYEQAEQLLDLAGDAETDALEHFNLAAAQIHATLAVAAFQREQLASNLLAVMPAEPRP